MSKIVFTGPECSGKTTLSLAISNHCNIPYVPELAREYLTIRDNRYDMESLSEIAFIQRWQEIETLKTSSKICCDTDLLTLLIWSKEKFNQIDDYILKLWQESIPELYVLCTPDIAWEYDAQRENQYDRDRLFEVYKYYLELYELNYITVFGSLENRVSQVERFGLKYII